MRTILFTQQLMPRSHNCRYVRLTCYAAGGRQVALGVEFPPARAWSGVCKQLTLESAFRADGRLQWACRRRARPGSSAMVQSRARRKLGSAGDTRTNTGLARVSAGLVGRQKACRALQRSVLPSVSHRQGWCPKDQAVGCSSPPYTPFISAPAVSALRNTCTSRV